MHALMSAFDPKRTSPLLTRMTTDGQIDETAESFYNGLRCGAASPDTGDQVPDFNLETGITVWARQCRLT